MTTLRTAAQQALEALEEATSYTSCTTWSPSMTEECAAAASALHAALAEPVQEPYCHVYEYDSVFGLHREFYPREYSGRKPDRTVPLFTAPPQRKPLSAIDLRALYDRHAAYQEEGPEASGWWDFARAIERAHGIT